MSDQCACGADVLWVINAEFPGMGLVLDPTPAESLPRSLDPRTVGAAWWTQRLPVAGLRLDVP